MSLKRSSAIRNELKKLACPAKARILSSFFKTGPGQYGEGDIFLGVTVPLIRGIARKHLDASFADLTKSIMSPFHEERLLSLLILVLRYPRADAAGQKKIYDFYLSHTKTINNWDLVDLSAPQIIGAYLEGRSKRPQIRLALSKNLWQRRIAILSTFYAIRQGRAQDTLRIAKLLLKDPHDLIHKAAGWMLREVGKRCSQETEEIFLRKYHKTMPRTMLRVAIERFPEKKRKQYLNYEGFQG